MWRVWKYREEEKSNLDLRISNVDLSLRGVRCKSNADVAISTYVCK